MNEHRERPSETCEPRQSLRYRLAFLACASLGVSACTVGPDFHRPETRLQSSNGEWNGTSASLRNSEGVLSKPSGNPAEIAAWWQVFGDTKLEALIGRAVAEGNGNLDLALAAVRIQQARAAVDAAAAGLSPTVDVNGTAQRSRSKPGGTGNVFRAGFDAAWEIDVFGGIRRGVESSQASLYATIEDWRDARIAVAAEVASTYFTMRGAQKQLAIARENLAAQQETLTVTRQRFEGGYVSGLDVANAESQVASTLSRIPAFEATIHSSQYAIGVLLGREPAALLDELSDAEGAGKIPALPADVPVGLPSDLLRRRPDIRAAEQRLHASTANVGVAVADLYPKFSITGSLGVQSGNIQGLGSLANRYWSVGPGVSWPLLDGGRIRANIRLQRALESEQGITYQHTVLLALQDVETSLVSFEKEQQRRAALEEAVAAARRAVELARLLYQEGKTDFLNVLTAQSQQFSTEDQLVQSERTVATNLVALYKALGGGWDEPAESGNQEPK